MAIPSRQGNSHSSESVLPSGSFDVAAVQKLFWTHTKQAFSQLFELTREQQCADPWLSHVLRQARHGNMSREVWCYLHGFPTLRAGSWNFDTQAVLYGRHSLSGASVVSTKFEQPVLVLAAGASHPLDCLSQLKDLCLKAVTRSAHTHWGPQRAA